jgi:hypothetical protein
MLGLAMAAIICSLLGAILLIGEVSRVAVPQKLADASR